MNENFELSTSKDPSESADDRIKELSPELLRANFLNWRERLASDLTLKVPLTEARENILRETEEFIRKLPLYNSLRLSGISFFADNPTLLSTRELRTKVKSISDISVTGTNSDDIEYGRDKFIFLTYGQPTFGGNDRLTIAIDPTVLDRQGVLVALQDLSIVRFRVQPESTSSLSWKNAWDQQKKEIWSGKDFKELFPLFLASSFDNPSDYHSKPFPASFFEATKENTLPEKYRIAPFEIMVPGKIETDEISFFAVGSESGFYPPLQNLGETVKKLQKPVIEIPKDLKGETLTRLLNEKFRKQQAE